MQTGNSGAGPVKGLRRFSSQRCVTLVSGAEAVSGTGGPGPGWRDLSRGPAPGLLLQSGCRGRGCRGRRSRRSGPGPCCLCEQGERRPLQASVSPSAGTGGLVAASCSAVFSCPGSLSAMVRVDPQQWQSASMPTWGRAGSGGPGFPAGPAQGQSPESLAVCTGPCSSRWLGTLPPAAFMGHQRVSARLLG